MGTIAQGSAKGQDLVAALAALNQPEKNSTYVTKPVKK